MTTSFTRIVIILSFARRALGTQQTPPNQIIIGLALFMTFFIMAPVWEEINDNALKPYFNGQIKAEVRTKEVDGKQVKETIQPFYVMLEKGVQPLREFMWVQLGEKGAKEVALFLYMAQMDAPESREDVPMRIMIPAFVVSELQKAFIVGFVLFIPFLIIDMVVASVLMSMGMMMLPPVMISMPFKILLFVMVDGWHILVRSIGLSFIAGG
jgi:flagellar biosynthetic protein FliP